MNEYPDFLNGKERENTLHIVVKHLTRQPAKGSRRLSGSISSRLTPRTFRTTRSNSGESVRVKSRALPEFRTKHASGERGRARHSDASTSSSFDDEDNNRKRGRSRLQPPYCGRTNTSSQNARTTHGSISDSSENANDRRKPLPRQLPICSSKNGRLVGRRKSGGTKNPELQLDLGNLSDSDDDVVDAVDVTKLQVPSSHDRVSDNSVGSGRRLVVTFDYKTRENLIMSDF